MPTATLAGRLGFGCPGPRGTSGAALGVGREYGQAGEVRRGGGEQGRRVQSLAARCPPASALVGPRDRVPRALLKVKRWVTGTHTRAAERAQDQTLRSCGLELLPH